MTFFLISLFLLSTKSFPLFEYQSLTLHYFCEYEDFIQEYYDVTYMYSIGIIFFIIYGTVFKKLKVNLFIYKTNLYKNIFFFKNNYFLVKIINLFICAANLRQKKLK